MNHYIKQLNLIKHPEGGYYKEIKRSSIKLEKDLPQNFSGERNLYTSIYFLLTSDEYSAWHRIKSEETWFYHDGGPLSIFIIDTNNEIQEIILGKNILEGEVLQYTVPANTIFASRCRYNNSFTLVSCTVYPGFDFQDFELFTENQLLLELGIKEFGEDFKIMCK
jgi:uncharacterized protein